jgi:hypothetical protein
VFMRVSVVSARGPLDSTCLSLAVAVSGSVYSRLFVGSVSVTVFVFDLYLCLYLSVCAGVEVGLQRFLSL